MTDIREKIFKFAVSIMLISALFVTSLTACTGSKVSTVNADTGSRTNSPIDPYDPYTYSVNSLTAIDSLGRTVPTVTGFEQDKYVGLFYFLWHGQHTADKTRNVTELLKTNYKDLFDPDPNCSVVPYGSWLHYNEPLYGYYNSTDEWVMRKHIEMFIAMNIDFLTIDFTNGFYYNRPLTLLLSLLREYKDAGWDVPQIMFYVNVDAQNLTQQIYENVYKKEKYKDLVFRGNEEKPLIVSVPDELSQELNDYFEVRASQWNIDKYREKTWPYWRFTREPELYTDMVSVSVAQTGTAFSFYFEGYGGQKKEAWGRGYSSSNPRNGDVDAILSGDNFQEMFDKAQAVNPEYIFITGWNEWVVQKMNLHEKLPDQFDTDFPDFTDNFNVEFSRDIEMTKDATYIKGSDGQYVTEGYGDNYLMQLAANVRNFKGINSGNKSLLYSSSVSIDINGDGSDWNSVNEKYLSLSTQKIDRKSGGFYRDTDYRMAKPDNFIKEVKVTSDSDNLYFRIETDEAITAFESDKTNRMNLFIGVENSSAPSWNGFNFVVNRSREGGKTASIERYTADGKYSFETAGSANYSLNGNVLQFEIPLYAIGIKGGNVSVMFKITDGIEKEDDILDYYVSGESFPIGRFAYTHYIPAAAFEPIASDEPASSANPQTSEPVISANPQTEEPVSSADPQTAEPTNSANPRTAEPVNSANPQTSEPANRQTAESDSPLGLIFGIMGGAVIIGIILFIIIIKKKN